MHPSTLFTILVSVVGTAQATCYRSGETWAPDQVQANNALSDVCNNLSNNFNGGQTKYASGNALYLNHGDCVLRLSNEINGCSRGGDTTIAGWNFR
ncbi:hypothetical protein N0V95_004017 [Ascochyta clinopodiicola]|nr:hypothetical protein N0V95_004017 [Ascochyta clinopodiicola]